MKNNLHGFEQFMKKRQHAAQAYVSGDPQPLGQLVADELPATFFAPMGGYERGPKKVASKYARDAAAFRARGESTFEILDMGASDDIAYWVGFQRATAHMRGNEKAVPFNLRITEVFRCENGEWKLVHRHADALVDEPDDQNPDDKK